MVLELPKPTYSFLKISCLRTSESGSKEDEELCRLIFGVVMVLVLCRLTRMAVCNNTKHYF